MQKYLLSLATVFTMTACSQISSKNKIDNTASTMPSLTKDQKMDTAFFWYIMDDAFSKGKYDYRIKDHAIFEQLIKLTPSQIQDFEIIFQQMNKKASTWENLAAHVAMEGSSSDDRFYYFRCWLISLGQKNFEETIKNPDYLAALDIPLDEEYGEVYCQFEELIPMADRAYETVTKKDPSSDTTFPRDNAIMLGLFYDSGTEMTGLQWKGIDLPRIVPQLYRKYGSK